MDQSDLVTVKGPSLRGPMQAERLTGPLLGRSSTSLPFLPTRLIRSRDSSLKWPFY